MIVYRIAKKEYIEDPSGNGAKRTGDRWNPKGMPILQSASTSSLAILEKLVSIDIDLLPEDLCTAALEIPKSKILKIPEEDLPKNWNHYPSPDALKSICKSWIELGNFCTLQIPSAVNSMESNYLINVKHPLMEKIKIKEVTPFRIDNRLSKY